MKKIVKIMLFAFLMLKCIGVSALEAVTIEQVIDAINNGDLAASYEESGGSLEATYDEDSVDITIVIEEETTVLSFDLNGNIISKELDIEAEDSFLYAYFMVAIADEIGQLYGYAPNELAQTLNSDQASSYTLENEGFEVNANSINNTLLISLDYTKKIPLADFSNVYFEVEDLIDDKEYLAGDGFLVIQKGNVYLNKNGYDGTATVVICEKESITSNAYKSVHSLFAVMFDDSIVNNYLMDNFNDFSANQKFGGVEVKINKFNDDDLKELPDDYEELGYACTIIRMDNEEIVKNAYKPRLTLEAFEDGTIKVTPKISTDGSCQIYRATSKTGKYTRIATIDSCSDGYVDSGVLPGKTYYYKTRTVNDGTYSEYSTISSIKAKLINPTITVKSVDKSTLLVDWEPVEGATGYQVYRATSKTGKYTLVKTTTSTSYKNTKLTPGKTYYYKVRAYKQVDKTKGYSSYSSVVSAVPKVSTPTYSAKNNGYNSVKLTINKVSGASGYAIYRSMFEEGPYELVTRTTKTTYTDKKLVTGNTYYYKVKAYSTVSGSKKYGNYGSIVSATPIPTAPNFTINNKLSAGYLKIEIEKVTGATGYDIYRYVDGEDIYLASIDGLTYIDDDVTLGQEYSYKVVAHRAENMGAFLGEFSDVKSAIVRPEVPTLTVKNNQYNSNTIIVNLNEGVYIEDNHKIYLYRSTSKTGDYDLIYEGTDFEYVDNDLTFNKTYYYKVVLERLGVKSEDSLAYSKKTALPKVVATATTSSKSSIKVTYDKVEGATGYEIYRATSKTGKYTKIKTTTALNYTNTGLTAGKTYYYKVRAYKTVSGTKIYGSYSDVISAIPKVGVPTYEVLPHTYNSNKITINKVSGASGYAIYRSNSEDGKYSLITTTTKTTYYDKSLQTGTTYYYKVRAYSLVGSSKKYGNYSLIQSATPYLESPKITFEKDSMNFVEINFNKISGAHGYEIYKFYPNSLEPVMIADTKELTYKDTDVVVGEMYTYYVRAYRTIEGVKVYSFEDKYNTKEVIPANPTIKVTNKSEIEQTVTVSLKEYDSSADTIVVIIRKINDGNFEVVYEDVPSVDDEGNAFVEFSSNDLTVGNTYTYRAYVLVNNIKSEDSSEVSKTAAYNSGNLMIMMNPGDLTKIDAILLTGGTTFSGMELYRSTTMDGEYSLVADLDSDFYEFDAHWNKTYYYKARYYMIVDGVKVYSEYSEPVKYKPTLNNYQEFPYVEEKDNYTIKINSVSFKLESSKDNNYTIKSTIKLDSTSNKERKVRIKIVCLPSMGDNTTVRKYFTFTVTIPKGSQSITLSDTETLPIAYTNFDIISIEEI